jgi:chromosome segregation ATPase
MAEISRLEQMLRQESAARNDIEQKLAEKDAHIETANTAGTEIKEQTQKQVESLSAQIAHLEQMLREQTLAGAEARQKLAAETETKEQMQKQVDFLTDQIFRIEKALQEETKAKITAEQKLADETQARLKAEQKAQFEAGRAAQAEEAEDRMQKMEDGSSVIGHQSSALRLTCDCCGRNNHLAGELTRIDSGHLFCADCLAALRR